jgi:Spherulation-specific family 4
MAVQIAVDPSGNVWLVKSAHHIYSSCRRRVPALRMRRVGMVQKRLARRTRASTANPPVARASKPWRRRLAVRWTIVGVVLAAIASVATVSFAMSGRGSAAKLATGQQVGVPAYFSPTASGPGSCSGPTDSRTCTSAWARLLDDANPNLAFAVADVDSGPGETAASSPERVAYRTTIRDMTQATDPIKVLGYVDTGYLGSTGLRTRSGGTTPQDWVQQAEYDINVWYSNYGPAGLGGIFLDQGGGLAPDGNTSCGIDGSNGGDSYSNAYSQLDHYIKTHHPDAFVVLNPGQVVPQCYQHSADTIVTFEGPASAYLTKVDTGGTWHYPWELAWTPANPDEIMHVVYGAAGEARLDDVMSLSKGNAGYIYVTDDASRLNPYGELPGGFSPRPSSNSVPWQGYFARELADA